MKKLITIALAIAGLVIVPSNNLRAQEAGQTETNRLVATGQLAFPVTFEWHPGSLRTFLEAIKSTYKVDLIKIADIPQQMLNNYTRVPAMKLNTSAFWNVLKLYNEIAVEYPQLGHWLYKSDNNGSRSEPTAILLIPPKQTEEGASLKIRAFSLDGLDDKRREQLVKLIESEQNNLRGNLIDPALVSGTIRTYPDEKILVANGGKTYIEMVETLVAAFRESFRGKP